MAEIPLTGASDEQMAEAVEENLFALFRAMAVLPGSELVEGEKFCHHLAFPSNPMFKGVWRTRLAADEVDAAIDQTVAWYQERSVPFAFWWVSHRTQPNNLPERLIAHGFAENIQGDPGMAADLHSLSDEILLPEGFTIEYATDLKLLEDWRDAFVAAFEVPVWAGQAWVDATLRLGVDAAPWQLYTGYLHGRPVATNILFKGAGVASVYGVGTVQEARGRGIGTAITLKPLLDARTQGYHSAVLFASDMGFPVYQKMGFRPVNCRIGRYLWLNG